MIYLDNASTTFPKPEQVYLEMDKVNRTLAVNAGRGSYKAAREATHIIEDTKEMLLQLFHAEGIADICFTPSVTHAINLVLTGIGFDSTSVVYVTPYEHNAVARPLKMLQNKYGFSVEFIPITEELRIDLEKTAYLFTQKKPSLVIINKVSNVTGYILPAEDLFLLAKKYAAITVMDAAQAAGLCPIDMRTLNADIVCFAGHKTLYGPMGIGGFILKHGIILNPIFAGGTGSNSLNLDMPETAPEKYEAASPNIISIAGLHAALTVLNQEEHLEHVVEMTEYLISMLSNISKIQLLGVYSAGITVGIVSFIVDGYSSSEVGKILDDEFDIAVRTGYHCAPFIHDYLNDKAYLGTVRIGIGMFTTKEEINCLIQALETL